MEDVVFLYVTAPDADAATNIAEALVKDNLAACVNILGPMRSIYEWEGRLCDEAEIPLIVKTAAKKAGDARDRILALHPYDTPCVAAFRVDPEGSSSPFLEWVAQAVKS